MYDFQEILKMLNAKENSNGEFANDILKNYMHHETYRQLMIQLCDYFEKQPIQPDLFNDTPPKNDAHLLVLEWCKNNM